MRCSTTQIPSSPAADEMWIATSVLLNQKSSLPAIVPGVIVTALYSFCRLCRLGGADDDLTKDMPATEIE